jgi:hypothetical protein
MDVSMASFGGFSMALSKNDMTPPRFSSWKYWRIIIIIIIVNFCEADSQLEH